MPINFELTFTQPLLFQLDTGQPRGSSDMARFITQNYVRTMLTGLPGGGTVPPVLPAPALGTPPPPFPIPALPINGYFNRQRAMQRVLKTYFEAREVLMMQADVKSTIRSVTLLIKKAQVLRRQINDLIRQAAELQRQLLQLPEIILALKNAIVDVIRSEQAQLEKLFSGLSAFRVSLSASAYQEAFRDELLLIDAVSSFKVTANPNDYRVIAEALSYLQYKIESIPDAQDGSEEEVFKRFFAKQVKASLEIIVNLSNAIVNPTEYIRYVQDLANVDTRLQPLLDALYRFQFIKSKLEPQIIKLKRRLQVLIDRLQQKIQNRIQEEKLKLKKKTQALAEKRAGAGKKSLYLKAGKILSDFKKKYLKKIKNARDVIREVRGIASDAQSLIVRANEFRKGIESFAERGFKSYLDSLGIDLRPSTLARNSSGAVEAEIDRILAQNNIRNPIIIRVIKAELVGKVISPTILLQFLEYRSNEIINVYRTFLSLVQDVYDLEARIGRLLKKKSANDKKVNIQQVEAPTVKDILYDALVQFETRLISIQKKLLDFINKQTLKLEQTIQRIADDVKIKLIMLVPIRSDLKDNKTRLEIIKAKKEKIKRTKDTVKKALALVQILGRKVLPGATQLSRNVARGEWRYSRNEGPLTRLIDGVYDIRKLKLSSPQQGIVLDDMKRKLQTSIRDYYFGLELLVDLFSKMSAEMSRSNFLEELGQRLKQNTVDTVAQGYVDLYNKLSLIGNLRNGNIQAIINFFSDKHSFRVLDKSYTRTVLLNIEKKYLIDTTLFLDQISLNPLVSRIFPGLKPGQDSLLAFVFTEINKQVVNIKNLLNRLYANTVKPLVDRINAKLAKIRDDIKAWIKQHVIKRAVNLDLKLMSIAFNIATRVFWTGFSWTMPNGVRYTCASIGPFLPLKSKPDSGASRLVRELATNLNRQLLLMTGVVSPPPFTGIPPFPFTGYR